MIKANELRIGNKVLFAPQGNRRHTIKPRVCEVNGLYEDTACVWDNALPLTLFYDSEDLRPIPLTPEVLLACGFEKVYDSDYRAKFDHIEKSQIGYDFTKKGVDQMMSGFRYYGNYIQHLSSLHQLQNLYFCLTGEELPYQQLNP